MSNGARLNPKMQEIHEFLEEEKIIITKPEKSSYGPDDWLSPLEEGTTFVSQEKNGWTPWLEEFTISCKGDSKISLLKNNRKSIETNSVICYWVDNEEFCRRNRLVEQLWIVVI